MDRKGQISVEFIFLILIFLIIMGSITIPLVGNSIDAAMDVSKVSDSKATVQNIANAVNIINANGPGAKRTLDVYLPNTYVLNVNDDTKIISFDVPLSNGTTKTVNASIDRTATAGIPLDKGWNKIQVLWSTDGITITRIS